MQTYEISYTEFIPDSSPMKSRRIVVGQSSAKNGIEAIKSLLRERLAADPEMLAEIEVASSVGSNKRVILAGIVFEARKLS